MPEAPGGKEYSSLHTGINGVQRLVKESNALGLSDDLSKKARSPRLARNATKYGIK